MLTQLNWVDIFIIILLIRICYVATKEGSVNELFKFSGVILGVYLSLHYYVRLSGFLNIFVRKKMLSAEILDFLSLIILVSFGYLVFVLLRESLSRFVRVEVVSTLNKVVAMVLGFFRALIVAGFLVFLFSVPVVNYLKKSTANSYLGRSTAVICVNLYKNIWNGFMSKFMLQEEFNDAVLGIEKGEL